MDETRRAAKGGKTGRRLLKVVLACALALPLAGAPALGSLAGVAAASTSSKVTMVPHETYGSVSYDTYSTTVMQDTESGNSVLCINPDKAPKPGTFSKHYDFTHYMKKSSSGTISNWRKYAVRALLYYGNPDSPGSRTKLGQDMWPDEYFDGTKSFSRAEKLSTLHVALAMTMTGDGWEEGTTDAFQAWVKKHITGGYGFGDGSVYYPKSLFGKLGGAYSRTEDSPYFQALPGGYKNTSLFSIYVVETGSESQNYMGFDYAAALGSVEIGKGDAQRYEHADGTYATCPQGDASFEGARLSVFNRSEEQIWADLDGSGLIEPGELFDSGALVTVVRTSYDAASGIYTASMPKRTLQTGKYEIVETGAPTGYRANGTVSRRFSIDKDGQVVQLLRADGILDDVVRGGILVEKQDAELKRSEAIGARGHAALGNTPYAGSSLVGIEFTVCNASKHGVMVNGSYCAPGAQVAKMTSAWDEQRKAYVAQTDDTLLPFGTYTVQETATNDSYLLTDGAARRVEVREHATLAGTDADGGKLVWKNRVVRNDMHFQKQAADTNALLANVAFLITNTTTSERHVAVTDRNGMLNTSSQLRAHTVNTNANDVLLDGRDIRTQDIATDAGIWFGAGEDGSMSEPDDSLGALPYGHYTVEELRCEANAGYELWSDSFDVYLDTSATALDADLGTVVDKVIGMTTVLEDAADGDHYVQDARQVKLVDHVSYSGLSADETEYMLEGTLVDAQTGQTLFDASGAALVARTAFKASAESGSVDVEFSFDATKLVGKRIVAFERLTCSTFLLAAHEDPGDERQSVRVAGLDTVLGDKGGSKAPSATANTRLTDTISYRGLKTDGTEYTVAGILMDKRTGNALTDGHGDPIAGEAKFSPSEPDGTVSVNFDIDASELTGKHIVAFEALAASDTTQIIARHEDMNDADQTVKFKGSEPKSAPAGGKTTAVKTSDQAATIIVGLTVAMLAAAGAGMLALKKRRI